MQQAFELVRHTEDIFNIKVNGLILNFNVYPNGVNLIFFEELTGGDNVPLGNMYVKIFEADSMLEKVGEDYMPIIAEPSSSELSTERFVVAYIDEAQEKLIRYDEAEWAEHMNSKSIHVYAQNIHLAIHNAKDKLEVVAYPKGAYGDPDECMLESFSVVRGWRVDAIKYNDNTHKII